MKLHVQFITTPQGEEFALLPKADYEKLLEVLEDYEDIKAARKFRAKLRSGEEELIPAEYVNRMIDGENKIKVWRDFRGMSAKALADAAGMSAPYLS
ncbi:transcriptional regulator [Ochrobactrum quorumnocens]|uniref:transcriptional regulator n=1 Tax=Ochrobactrum quorumnocens TaxID=271865 RepID=UPI0029E8196F|nr:transcriptional regulator [[Ochrobactrum] quorumnocens]